MTKVPYHKKIKIPIWGNRWIFLLKYTPENVKAIGKDYTEEDEDSNAMVTPMGYGRYALFYKDTADIAELAHECLHITHRIMGELGHIFADYNNDEAEAYLFTYILRAVLTKYKQMEGKNEIKCHNF